MRDVLSPMAPKPKLSTLTLKAYQYPSRYPEYHQTEAIRPLTEVHWVVEASPNLKRRALREPKGPEGNEQKKNGRCWVSSPRGFRVFSGLWGRIPSKV